MSEHNPHNTDTTNNAGFPPAPSEAHQRATLERQERLMVANTIYSQLGGARFSIMTGAKNLIAIDKGLQLDLPSMFAREGVNRVQIILEPCDTYTVKAYRRKGLECVEVASEDGIYCDMLRDSFTRITGLDTHL